MLRRCLHIVDLQFCEERGSERRASQTIETNQCSDTCSTHNYKPANQRERPTWPAILAILCLKGHMTKSESLKILKQAS